MSKVIHPSWTAMARRSRNAAASVVAFDFEGSFAEGSYAGETFRGHLRYDRNVYATTDHSSFALYEEWARPIVTMVVAGQALASQGAAVYDGVFDGASSHHDFVTFYGADRFDGVEGGGSFELFFASEAERLLRSTRMPTATQLAAFPVRQVSFVTSQPGNVISRGDLQLIPVDYPLSSSTDEIERMRRSC